MITVAVIVLVCLTLIASYLAVGVLFGPTAYHVGRETCSIKEGEFGRDYARRRGDERGRAMQLATVFCWPVMVPYILSHNRRLADEKSGPNPDGLSRKQLRDLAYQKSLLGYLEDQQKAAEAALQAQYKAQALLDRSPLNLR